MLDELRRQDWAPRSLRRWERDIAKAREQFCRSTAAARADEELAEALATTVPRCAAASTRSGFGVTSLNTLVISDDETTIERMDTLVSEDRASTPSTDREDEAKDKFRRAFERLPQREREVAVLLY